MMLDALMERHGHVTWQLLLSLLPEQHAVGTPTHTPRFRDWADEGERDITYAEYYLVIEAVAERVLRLAIAQPSRWADVITAFDRLPEISRSGAIEGLDALNTEGLLVEESKVIWTAVEEFIRRHREFPEADWSVDEKWLSSLAVFADRVRPDRARERFRWLFDDWRPDLGITLRDDFDAGEREVDLARKKAVTEIVADEGFGGVTALAEDVKLPWAVGSALARMGRAFELEALSLLDSEHTSLVQFADGFARVCGTRDPTIVREWIHRFDARPVAQARMLLVLEDVEHAWDMLKDLSDEVVRKYWAEFMPYGRGAEFSHASEVARQLLRHGRAAMAVDTLSLYATRNTVEVHVVVEALEAFGTVEDPEAARVSEYDLNLLFDYLREHNVDEATLARLEWKFLPALHGNKKLTSLQRRLARDPAFFVELIGYAFNPSGGGKDSEPSHPAPKVAVNAYRLLREWRTVPGSDDDGKIDSEKLQAWLSEVRFLLSESGYLEIGELEIGAVLAYSPTDSDGTFPTRAVRRVIETAPNDRYERGFIVGLHNKRGITSRGMTDGGKQEYVLAQQYDTWADRVEATDPRTAGALRSVADSYRDEGRRNDEEARRFLEGMDW
jgi:hypothetical protein